MNVQEESLENLGLEKFESYRVRDVARKRIEEEIPDFEKWNWVDAFSDIKNAQFGEFWVDAFSQDWDKAGRKGKTLWINPPYPKWEEAAKRIMRNRVRCVCILPDWGRDYERPLVEVATQRLYIPSGASLFEAEGRLLPPSR